MSTPRPYTEDELRDELLQSIHGIVQFWAERGKSPYETGCGVAFSILSLLDGCSSMPGFALVARPHPLDKQYDIDNGDNWIEEGTTIDDVLHEHWHRFEERQT